MDALKRRVFTAYAEGRIDYSLQAKVRAFLDGDQADRERSKTARAEKKQAAKKGALGAAVAHHAKDRACAEREEAASKRRMHGEVWLWNLEHTRDAGAPHGRCDCSCGYAFRFLEEGECDHWKGRRGADAHTRANGWRLRRECHEEKDGRRPMPPGDVPFNARRRAYCERAGIPFVPRKEMHR